MRLELVRALIFTLSTLLLFGGVYPAVVWGIGRLAFPGQAEGSLIRRADGSVVGSTLIAQAFTRPAYFHPRPSAVDYDAAATGGSNLATSSPEQARLTTGRLDAIRQENGVTVSQVPAELVTASGSGLDPHLTLAAASLQESRVAQARGVSRDRVHAVVTAQTDGPWLGLFGPPRVNVLVLNLALDAAFGPAPQRTQP